MEDWEKFASSPDQIAMPPAKFTSTHLIFYEATGRVHAGVKSNHLSLGGAATARWLHVPPGLTGVPCRWFNIMV